MAVSSACAAARAQRPAMPVIGFLNGGSPSGYASNVNAFHQGLKEAGYTDGQNVTIAYRWANDELDRLPALTDNLVRLGVSVIVANTPANLIAKSATTTIPIVFTTGGDPVKLGLVASLDRPGGNVTGATQLNQELVPKRLELLHELLPAVTVIALLINPTDSGFAVTREIELAARNLGLQLQVLQASTERDFDEVFASLIRLRAGGLVISPGAFFANHWAHWRSAIRSQRYLSIASSWRPVDWLATQAASQSLTVWPASIVAASSRAKSPPIFPSSGPPKSRCTSI